MISFLTRSRKSRRAISMRAWTGVVLILIGLAFLTFHLRDSVLMGAGNGSSATARAEKE